MGITFVPEPTVMGYLVTEKIRLSGDLGAKVFPLFFLDPCSGDLHF
jgi:hypothetical protein